MLMGAGAWDLDVGLEFGYSTDDLPNLGEALPYVLPGGYDLSMCISIIMDITTIIIIRMDITTS